MKLPNASDVATALRNVQTEFAPDEAADVRLQVYPDASWVIRFGDPSYDTDHHGVFGASTIPAIQEEVLDEDSSALIAAELIDQVEDQLAEVEVV